MVRTVALVIAFSLAGCASHSADYDAAGLEASNATAQVADLSIRVQMLEMDKTKLETKVAQLESALSR